MSGTVRLFVEGDLAADAAVAVTADQAHYLGRVMRLGAGDQLLVFNGRDGEWRAVVDALDKRGGRLTARRQSRPQSAEPDPADQPWLAFAPIKKIGTDFIAQKATELGAARLLPVITANTQTNRVRCDRLRATALEAAEQCGRLSLPDVLEPAALGQLALDWPKDRRLFLLDETGVQTGRARFLAGAVAEHPGPCGFLVGPEGGFIDGELDRLARLPFVTPVTLGPRILRAETACLAALAGWQTLAGDGR